METGRTLAAGGITIAIACLAAAGPQDDSLVPGRATVLRLAVEKEVIPAGGDNAGVGFQVLDPLEDGRVPVIIHELVPSRREKEGWELELDELEKKVSALEVEVQQAGESTLFETAHKLEAAKRELDAKRIQAEKEGHDVDLSVWDAAELDVLLLRKRGASWTLAETLALGRFDAKALGAPPAHVEIEGRTRDYNQNGITELSVTAFVELHTGDRADVTGRPHKYQFLVEPFADGARLTFELDGGVESAGTCEGPLDQMMTARYWFKGGRRTPGVLVVGRSNPPCEPEENQPDIGKVRAGITRYAWSEKNLRWQVFDGIEPEAFLIVAATNRERKPLAKTLKHLKRRKIQRRMHLGRAYPRILATDEVPGLKAGFHALVIGLCEDKQDARHAAQALRRKFRGKGIAYRVRGILKEGGPRLPVVCPDTD